MDGMNKALEDFLAKILQKVHGLQAVLVTDREGVELGRVTTDSAKNVTAETVLAAIFSTAAEQAGKCGLGKTNTMVSFYKNYTVVHMSYLPLVVTFYGTEDLNVGLIQSITDELRNALTSLQSSVQSVENEMI